MAIQKINFSYNTKAVSEKQFDEHIKLYEGYVNKANEISDILTNPPEIKKANAIYSKYRELKKEETFALDGVILHEEYFKNMTSHKQMPQKNTLILLDKFFGNFENWKEDFKACAKSARGWCITSFDIRQKKLTTFLQDSHDWGCITLAYPLIVLDMYEHAYFIDYGTKKDEYIDKFFESINWDLIETKAAKVVASLY